MTENLLKPGERLDDLQRNGLHIIQHPQAFRFGMDAVLLADFTRLRPRERVADMGTAPVFCRCCSARNSWTPVLKRLRSSRKWRTWLGARSR